MFVMKDVKTIFMQIVKFICKIYFFEKKNFFLLYSETLLYK